VEKLGPISKFKKIFREKTLLPSESSSFKRISESISGKSSRLMNVHSNKESKSKKN